MIGMYDTAKAIQDDRRHRAALRRVVNQTPAEHSLVIGRYRLTLARKGHPSQV